MTYKETIEYLYNQTPVFEHTGASAYKEGLSNTHALDEHFGHPHRKYKTIHIAGTNGKGSCSHTIASILQEEGYKVGLYTSPHLIDFRERIRINGQPISEEYVVDFVEKEKSFFEPLYPSFFELTTALALKYFADEQVDYAVIEVGLGGRLDCTNIIRPEFSVITNISFDHTNLLGNTLESITKEKAGIIKNNVPVVIGQTTQETRHVFITKAKEENAPLLLSEEQNEIISWTHNSNGGITYVTKHFGTINADLGGYYQPENMRTILCAADILIHNGIVSEENVRTGISKTCANTGLMGRWQQFGNDPKRICDTGHNVAGWEYISKQLILQPYKSLRIVFGMVDDKDIETVVTLLPKNAIYYFTQAQNKRAVASEKVKEIAKKVGITGKNFEDVASAYNEALKDAAPEDFIFVGGSSYIVADLLTFLQQQK